MDISRGDLFKAKGGSPSSALADSFGRRFEYLRLSLTDICNFSCTYCLPHGFQKVKGTPKSLSIEEYIRVVRAFAELGVWKLRLTGGEPTIRPDFLEIAAELRAIPGIRHMALTTNGYRLASRAADYARTGVNAINISIDSLRAADFHAITGHNRLAEILEGIEACQQAGIGTIKINTVLLNGVNDGQLDEFIHFIRSRDLSLRFIELMRTNDNAEFFAKHHVRSDVVVRRLEELGWQATARLAGAGPAVEYGHEGAKGKIGIIAPYSDDFCASCNRLRISARGKMHLCLFGEGGYDLRPLLQSDESHEALLAEITRLVGFKKETHFLHEGNSGTRAHLASIGG